MFCKKKIMAFLWKVNIKWDGMWPYSRCLYCSYIFFINLIQFIIYVAVYRGRNVMQKRQIASGTAHKKNDSVSGAMLCAFIVISLTVRKWAVASAKQENMKQFKSLDSIKILLIHSPTALTRLNNHFHSMHFVKQVRNQDHFSIFA